SGFALISASTVIPACDAIPPQVSPACTVYVSPLGASLPLPLPPPFVSPSLPPILDGAGAGSGAFTPPGADTWFSPRMYVWSPSTRSATGTDAGSVRRGAPEPPPSSPPPPHATATSATTPAATEAKPRKTIVSMLGILTPHRQARHKGHARMR